MLNIFTNPTDFDLRCINKSINYVINKKMNKYIIIGMYLLFFIMINPIDLFY